MRLIIHGEDTSASRAFLNTKLDEFKRENFEILRLDANSTSQAELVLSLEPQTLFRQNRAVVLEGLLSRRESSEKKEMIVRLKKASGVSLILWEGKSVKATELSKLNDFEPKEFKLASSIFEFLDSWGVTPERTVKLFHRALKTEPAEKIVASLSTRLHLLLLAKIDPENLPAQGFYRSKILSQSRQMTVSEIEKSIAQLLQTEYDLKSGKSTIPLESSIDFMILKPESLGLV